MHGKKELRQDTETGRSKNAKYLLFLSILLLLSWSSITVVALEKTTVPEIGETGQSNGLAPIFYGPNKIRGATVWEDSPDVAVTTASNTTQSENSVFIDPNNPLVVLNANNSSDWPVNTIYGIAAWVSTDGGQTWTGDVYGPVPETRADPATGINVDGKMFTGYITMPDLGQGVARSDDMGSNWTHKLIKLGGYSSWYMLDKNHLWVDNSSTSSYNGYLYSSWTNLMTGDPMFGEIEIARSTDVNVSWSTAVAISTGVNAGSHNQGVNNQTGPNGEVYVVWAIYDSWPSDETALGFAKSLDGGATWSPATRILENIRGIRSTELGGGKNMRVNSFPSMTVNQQTGQIFVVWTNIGIPGVNTGDPDIYMISSVDGGSSWSTPSRVNQDGIGNGKDQWFGWIACDPITGNLVCISYDSRNYSANDMVETFVAVSLDNGATWEDQRVSDAAWSGDGIPGFGGNYAGDYLGIDILDNHVYPIWSDPRSGNMLAYVSPFQIGPAPSQTIWVDGTYGDDVTGDGSVANPYETIGKGISMANDGDDVQVRPGVYVENIDFSGKGIILNGFYGPEMTILKPANPDESTVKMVSGEPAGTQFSGFTFRDGGDCYPFLIDGGAEPLITNNIFTFNIRNVVGNNKAVIKTSSSAPVITRNLFFKNSGISCVGIWSGTATITSNTFDNNARGFLTISPQGGIARHNIVTNSWQYGIHGNFTELDYNDVWNNNPDYNLNNPGPHDISVDPLYIDAASHRYYLEYNSPCIDAGDPSKRDPDFTTIDLGVFHAVYVPYQASTIQDALTEVAEVAVNVLVYPGTYTENIDFWGRHCRLMSVDGPETTILQPAIPNNPTIKMIDGEDERTLLSGFKIINGGDEYTFMISNGALPLIRDNVFWYNIRNVPGENKSVIRTDNSVPFFYKNLFYENGGISCIAIYTGSGEIVNNTFDDNGRGFLTLTGQGIAKNNIVTNSWEYGIHGNFTELDYNDVWNNNPDYNLNNPGPNDISADPLYTIDYRLQEGSPCIDAGDPAVRYNDPDGSRNDMGAYSFVSFYIEVPQDYATIQEAIDGAPDEDATIYVSPGVYNENIDFIGKTIRLTGAGNTASGDTTYLEPYVEDNPTVWISNGEGAGTELSGFTIREGGDTYTITIGSNASPLIANNVFYNNILCGLPDHEEDDILLRPSSITPDTGMEHESETGQMAGLPGPPPPPPGCGYNKVIIKCVQPSGTPVIQRNLFYHNGGISCVGVWTNAYAEIINNTFDDNPRGFLTISVNGGVALNNIVTNSDDYGIYGTWTELDYNDVWNNNPNYQSANPGPNSIEADPRYVNPGSRDYYLQGLSPCIDAGHPDPQYNDPDGSRNDMGAFPYTGLPPFVKETLPVPIHYSLSQNYPNPFNPRTAINYGLPEAAHVKVEIFNILGQRVTTLVNSHQEPGHYQVMWDSKDGFGHAVASGIYIYRMTTDSFAESRKMVLLK
jgi:hypothetical protein